MQITVCLMGYCALLAEAVNTSETAVYFRLRGTTSQKTIIFRILNSGRKILQN
jgi:hypothetical protein